MLAYAVWFQPWQCDMPRQNTSDYNLHHQFQFRLADEHIDFGARFRDPLPQPSEPAPELLSRAGTNTSSSCVQFSGFWFPGSCLCCRTALVPYHLKCADKIQIRSALCAS
jgi:hypothetical protein